MLRSWFVAGLLATSFTFVGCSGRDEIKPEDKGGQKLDQDAMNKAMEESQKHMPKEQADRIKAQMEMMKKMQQNAPK